MLSPLSSVFSVPLRTRKSEDFVSVNTSSSLPACVRSVAELDDVHEPGRAGQLRPRARRGREQEAEDRYVGDAAEHEPILKDEGRPGGRPS